MGVPEVLIYEDNWTLIKEMQGGGGEWAHYKTQSVSALALQSLCVPSPSLVDGTPCFENKEIWQNSENSGKKENFGDYSNSWPVGHTEQLLAIFQWLKMFYWLPNLKIQRIHINCIFLDYLEREKDLQSWASIFTCQQFPSLGGDSSL